ncbi:MAG: hypothetical protein A3G25_14545 [Betaproteobacteria bacterium RIFCSPLOWO2_12_FULL_63_13]|nr:MAG: hypothetical protein A3G25_14545 [Betaproteobacteria bacterium RIFCSPLOWO2_12_FULL_63_13]OGT84316.1 MAG: hypothetical protein A3H91_09285 [Gammaproteobacteria bacterium RIFCSPLOWO2_02_FULL_61_13]
MQPVLKNLVSRIVSGGQTGADRAALDWAIRNDVPHGGWCPRGRKAEDGVLPAKYKLRETESKDYRQRTRQNVIDSDGTLVLNLGALDGGTLKTVSLAEQLGKPHLVLQLDSGISDEDVLHVLAWLRRESISILNVAGPRESKRLGIYSLTNELLDRVAKPAHYQPTEEKIEVGRAGRPPEIGTYTPPVSYQARKRKPSNSSS